MVALLSDLDKYRLQRWAGHLGVFIQIGIAIEIGIEIVPRLPIIV
jgi:hypothetical protein